jgi:lipopolysaccharide biosynthesis protein
MFTLLAHIYYPHSWEQTFKEPLRLIAHLKFDLLINLSIDENNDQLKNKIKSLFSNAFIIETPNKGKDVGGKLALIDLLLRIRLNNGLVVFLHDKKSPQATTGDQWREKLFKIIEPQTIQKIIGAFHNNSQVGVIGTKDFILNEFDKKSGIFKTPNNLILQQLMKRYSLSLSDYRFIGGTMFWARLCILKKFFEINPPLMCRTDLEEGNVLDEGEGTYTHAWERIFCWISTAQGYQLKGV